jgi:hypothetical protein
MCATRHNIEKGLQQDEKDREGCAEVCSIEDFQWQKGVQRGQERTGEPQEQVWHPRHPCRVVVRQLGAHRCQSIAADALNNSLQSLQGKASPIDARDPLPCSPFLASGPSLITVAWPVLIRGGAVVNHQQRQGFLGCCFPATLLTLHRGERGLPWLNPNVDKQCSQVLKLQNLLGMSHRGPSIS